LTTALRLEVEPKETALIGYCRTALGAIVFHGDRNEELLFPADWFGKEKQKQNMRLFIEFCRSLLIKDRPKMRASLIETDLTIFAPEKPDSMRNLINYYG